MPRTPAAALSAASSLLSPPAVEREDGSWLLSGSLPADEAGPLARYAAADLAVARVVEAWRSGAGPVVTATYGGRPGHPKLFDRRLLPDLLRLTGDTGARDLLAAHPDRVHRVEVGDLGSDADVDVEADLDRVGAMLINGGTP